MEQGMAPQAVVPCQQGIAITFVVDGLSFLDPAVRLGNHSKCSKGTACAVVVTNLLGQPKSFIRGSLGSGSCLPMTHHRAPQAIEPLDTHCERRSMLALLSRPQVQVQHAFE